MDVLDQVARLVADLEANEQKKQADQEMAKAIQLHEATRDYLECVRVRKWKKAHDRLARILQLMTSIISKPAAE